MSHVQTRQLGTCTRIYKNSNGKVIALDCIAVNYDKSQISINKFHNSVNTINVKRTLLHLTAGGSRVVDLIQMIGDYSSLEDNSGNYFVATWNASSPNENDIEVSFEQYVSKIGDTI
jgi:hypothetical protein